MAQSQPEGASRGEHALAIANAISRLYREHYGRGPTSARTLLERSYVACFLTDIFTPMERTLLDAGREEVVRETRRAFQQAMRPEYVDAVEAIVGTRVVAFMSQIHVDPDMAVEVFVLDDTGS